MLTQHRNDAIVTAAAETEPKKCLREAPDDNTLSEGGRDTNGAGRRGEEGRLADLLKEFDATQATLQDEACLGLQQSRLSNTCGRSPGATGNGFISVDLDTVSVDDNKRDMPSSTASPQQPAQQKLRRASFVKASSPNNANRSRRLTLSGFSNADASNGGTKVGSAATAAATSPLSSEHHSAWFVHEHEISDPSDLIGRRITGKIDACLSIIVPGIYFIVCAYFLTGEDVDFFHLPTVIQHLNMNTSDY